MLKEINRNFGTTVWLQVKSLKMNIMNYLMLVIIFPISYLVISVVSGADSGSGGPGFPGSQVKYPVFSSIYSGLFFSDVTTGNNNWKFNQKSTYCCCIDKYALYDNSDADTNLQ